MQGHNVSFYPGLVLLLTLAGSNEANASMNFTPPIPGAAEQKFVRQCVVQLSVRNQNMLPIEALQDFCETTDAIVECKLKISMKLETVHERGRGMVSFCHAAYDWVQEKYGMLCPMQCEKLQCKSTCLWLEKNRKLKTEAEELKADNLASTNLKRQVDEAEFAADDAKMRFLSSNRTVHREKDNVNRAQDLVQDRQKLVKNTQEKVLELEPKLFKLEQVVANLDSLLEQREENIENLQFELDKVELKQEHLLRKEKELNGKILKGSDELEQFSAKVIERKKELDDKLKQINDMLEAQKDLGKIVTEQHSVVNKWMVAYKRADFHVQNAIKEKAPKTAIEDLEDLRRQQKERLKKETAVMNKAEQKLQYLQDEAKRYVKDTKMLSEWLKESKIKAANKTQEVAQLAADMKSAQLTAENTAKGVISKLVSELSKRRKAASNTTEEYKKANRTLELTQEVHEQETARLKEQVAAIEKLRKELDLAEEAFEQAAEDLQSSAKSYKEAHENANVLKKEYVKLYQGMLDGMKANRAAQRALRSWKPEIVGQHGLALLQSFLE